MKPPKWIRRAAVLMISAIVIFTTLGLVDFHLPHKVMLTIIIALIIVMQVLVFMIANAAAYEDYLDDETKEFFRKHIERERRERQIREK